MNVSKQLLVRKSTLHTKIEKYYVKKLIKWQISIRILPYRMTIQESVYNLIFWESILSSFVKPCLLDVFLRKKLESLRRKNDCRQRTGFVQLYCWCSLDKAHNMIKPPFTDTWVETKMSLFIYGSLHLHITCTWYYYHSPDSTTDKQFRRNKCNVPVCATLH